MILFANYCNIVHSNQPYMNKVKRNPSDKEQGLLDPPKGLILFNDPVNLFEFVVKTLMDVCNHDPYQAEQCTLVAHHKGKCQIKEGAFPVLKPIWEELTRRGLTVTID